MAKVKRWTMLAALCVIAFNMAGCFGCTYIPPGYVGIKVNLYGSQRGVQDIPVLTGRVIYNPWTEKIYGVPPEQVIGSSIKTKFVMRDGIPTIFRLPEVNFIDDKAGKPVGINEYVGHRPIAAFGNSDGDLEMLQWTTLTDAVRFGMIIHHTDAEREYAYDRQSHFGRLDVALDLAATNQWTVVDMKRDWKIIFPFQKQ